MGWLVLIVLASVAAYVMKPDERLRVAKKTLRPIEDLWFAYQDDRARPDAFRDALQERTRWPIVTALILAVDFTIYVASPFAHPGFFGTLVGVLAIVQAALLVERILGHTAAGVLFVSGSAVGSVIDLSRQPLVPTFDSTGGVFAMYGALLAIVVRGLLNRSPMTIPVRALRPMVPAAALFALYGLGTGRLLNASGLVPLALGFVFGIVLARHMSESRAPINRVAAVAVATAFIVAIVGVPLRGVMDARPEIARLLELEERTAADYAKARDQFKLGAMKAEAVAQMIDKQIVPPMAEAQTRLRALTHVPAEQQPLLSAAGEYVALRIDTWQLRSRALHKSSMRLLRDAEEKERTALAALDRLRNQAPKN